MIFILSGTENVNINKKFDTFVYGLKVNYNLKDDDIIIYKWPEKFMAHHPKTLYDKMKNFINEAIELNKHVIIMTYSDIVLNAIRVCIKKHQYNQRNCVYQYTDNEHFTISNINKDGCLDIWIDGIFDIWDNALTELL